MNDFIIYVGLCLGAVITFCTVSMLSFKPWAVHLFVLNSFAGSAALLIMQILCVDSGIDMCIRPIGAIGVGILGLPGAFAAAIVVFII